MSSNFKNIHLLGLAPSTIALQLSLLQERYGECEFHIYKNIPVPKSPDFRINSEAYQIKIHPVGIFPESDNHSSDLLLFGVPGPKAKETVFNYFCSGEGSKNTTIIQLYTPEHMYLGKLN